MNPYTVKPVGENVLIVRFDDIKSGWDQWLMLTADRHHDNVYCRRDVERKHLAQAKERSALIVDCGDLFCAMQGKYDPRSNMDDIRPEDVGQDYLDMIVTHAVKDYAPYANNWLMVGRGNHETNIRKRHGTDLIVQLANRLNFEHGANVHVGGYGGWVRFMFVMNRTKRKSINLKYHHGAGGGGPVTKGVIQTNRQAVYLPDADIVVNGHTHDAWYVPIERERLSIGGKIYLEPLHFIRTPGYKDEYDTGAKGFHNESWRPPKPVGCAWVHFIYNASKSTIDTEIMVTVV